MKRFRKWVAKRLGCLARTQHPETDANGNRPTALPKLTNSQESKADTVEVNHSETIQDNSVQSNEVGSQSSLYDFCCSESDSDSCSLDMYEHFMSITLAKANGSSPESTPPIRPRRKKKKQKMTPKRKWNLLRRRKPKKEVDVDLDASPAAAAEHVPTQLPPSDNHMEVKRSESELVTSDMTQAEASPEPDPQTETAPNRNTDKQADASYSDSAEESPYALDEDEADRRTDVKGFGKPARAQSSTVPPSHAAFMTVFKETRGLSSKSSGNQPVAKSHRAVVVRRYGRAARKSSPSTGFSSRVPSNLRH